MKYDYSVRDRIYYTERIHGNGYWEEFKDYWCNIDFEKFALNNECNMQDIIPFLPPNHPDLIQNKIYELW